MDTETSTTSKMNSRLTFQPMNKTWLVEKIDDSGRIMDFYELTSNGVVMRYPREEILGSRYETTIDLLVA
jgi:hypothetical protein